LGNNNLIKEFDKALDSLLETKAIILDLRNTLNGGNTYVAKGIMSRFISKEKAYQKHSLLESYTFGLKIKRTFVEYVSPRGKQYQKPLIVLVGRWTGSMGKAWQLVLMV
jgi:carboxyl-terminal processing protease